MWKQLEKGEITKPELKQTRFKKFFEGQNWDEVSSNVERLPYLARMMRAADEHRSDVTIPLSAVYAPSQGGTYVWVVNSDDCVEQKMVVLGSILGRDRVVVTSGLEAGERIVVAGVYRLQQGEKVKILNR